ncbi:MAG: T9SS type A sorting domain-containing protein [Bacteroidia bacterium]|nr:T9SS type A sorting domain-containing protein [Bacteroidia bacterium]
MKNFTILFVFIFGYSLAQTPTNYLEVSAANSKIYTTTEDTRDTDPDIDGNNPQDVLDTYTTLGDFNAAVANCDDTNLVSEDFANGPVGITDCGITVSAAGDGCFTAGELEAGFTVEASNGTSVVNIPPGQIGNTDSLIGAITFAEFTIINFSPDVYAVAMDIWENNDPTTDVRVFGAGGALIESFNVNTPVNVQTFFGVIADEPITKIELEGFNGSGELFGNFLYGADCMNLSIDENVRDLVRIFPNPASDNLFIYIPARISINDVKIYDIIGKSIHVNTVNNQVNIGELGSGLYFINIDTSHGIVTKRFMKK